MVTHTFNPKTQEAETSELKGYLVYIVPGQSEVHNETLSQTQQNKNTEGAKTVKVSSSTGKAGDKRLKSRVLHSTTQGNQS